MPEINPQRRLDVLDRGSTVITALRLQLPNNLQSVSELGTCRVFDFIAWRTELTAAHVAFKVSLVSYYQRRWPLFEQYEIRIPRDIMFCDGASAVRPYEQRYYTHT